jgi:NADPH:quinone reductase-like Zn-dependent oxidoreductase
MSDMAGEVVAVGEDVKGFKVGDRVSANRCLDHVEGDVTPETMASATGYAINGVLTEYKAFPPHGLVHIPDHLTYEEASTLP